MKTEHRVDSHHRRGARVLVADDDEATRALIGTTLRRDGFDVLEAASGSDAARIIESVTLFEWSARAIDLVVTDIRMSGMTGLELGWLLREARWDVPLILITAFPEADVTLDAERLGATLLFKPFRLEHLRRSVLTSIAAHVQLLRAEPTA